MDKKRNSRKSQEIKIKNLLKLGKLRFSLDKTDEAIVLYKKVLDIDNNCKEALEQLELILSNYSRIFSINQAIVVPVNIQNHDKWAGGVCYPQNIPQTFRQRRLDVLSQQIVCLDQFIDINTEMKPKQNTLNNDTTFYSGTYIFAGPFFTHFGHALTESIHRLWAFNELLHDGIVFAVAQWQSIYSGIYHPPKWFVEILEIMKIPISKCIFVTNRSVFEKLLIPEPGSELSLGPKEWYHPHLKRLQQRILYLTRTLRGEKLDLKIFLGRSHIPLKGGVAGEQYFKQLLETEGFVYLIPEKFSIVKQLSFLVNAKKIIFTEGSAIYLIELLNYLNTEIACIPRRPDNIYFSSHIVKKCYKYIIVGDVDNISVLGSYDDNLAACIAVSKNPHKVAESLRFHNIVSLESWDENKFFCQERLDVISYINDGFSLLKNQNSSNCLNVKNEYIKLRKISDQRTLQNFSNFLNKLHLTDGKKKKLDNFINVGPDGNVDIKHDLMQGIPEIENSVSLIFTEHLLEQYNRTQILFILRECKRVLDTKGKAVLRVSTTDLEFIAKTYINGIDSEKGFLKEIGLDKIINNAEFVNTCMRSWNHKYVLDENELKLLARYVGFRDIGRQVFRQSKIADLRNLETIKNSLIIEFEPNINYPSQEFPLVSVLIPAYRHTYFEETLLSALKQSYSNVEILVSDDSCSQEIEKIVHTYKNEYSNVTYFKNNPSLGEIKSTQKLIDSSAGKYLQILHDDDLLEEKCIETFVKLMELNPSASLISSSNKLVDAQGIFQSINNQYFDKNIMLYGPTVAYSSFYRINGIAHLGEPSHFMFKRDDILSLGEAFNCILGQEIKVAIDIALHYKLLSLGNWIFVSSPLSTRRNHSLQSIRQSSVQEEGKISSNLLIQSFQNLGLNNSTYQSLKVLELKE